MNRWPRGCSRACSACRKTCWRRAFQSSRSFVWISRKLPPEKVEAVAALNLKGIYFQEENQRFYPKRDLAAHVLGFVDPDEKGLGGIEYRAGQPDSR